MTKLEQLRALAADLGTPEALAERFCELDDDAQAQFFVHVARIAEAWFAQGFGTAPQQAFNIGKHLATCECSTHEARAFVRNIHDAMVDV